METPTKRLYLFADFCLDATDCQLRRRDEVVALPPKVFDTLRVLVENRGRILDKEFLMKSLWPNTFVEDGTLAQYVFLLRKALNDDSSEHRFIETIPRRGYRFVAPVQEVTDAEASDGAQLATLTAQKNGAVTREESTFHTNGAAASRSDTTNSLATAALRTAPFRFALVALAFLLSAALLLGGYFFFRRNEAPLLSSQTMQIAKLTTNGKAGIPALSPDGKYVAYRADDAGQQSIWLRQLAAANGVVIVPPTEMELTGLTFAPDGNHLYYTAYQRPPVYGALYRVPVLGGSPVKLLDDVDSAITFAPDGKRITFVRLAPLEGESYIITANPDGSQQQKLATRKLPAYFYHEGGLAWSPDGTLIACAAGGSGTNGPFMNFVAVNTTSGQETPLTQEPWRSAGQIAWHKDGKGLVGVARQFDSPLASDQLWFFPFPVGTPRKITNDLNVYSGVNLSQDWHQLVTVQSTKVANFWLVPATGTSHATQIGSQSIDNHAHRLGLTWTPGGKLLFGSYASGNADLWLMDVAGGQQQQLTTDPKLDLMPAVSPDGRAVAFVSNRGGGFSIWRMEADGLNVTRLTTGQADHFPNFTPDGQWVFYTSSTDEQPTVWKVPAAGGKTVQVTALTAFGPAVSPDGKWVAMFVVVPQALLYKLAYLPITGGAPVKIFDVTPPEIPVVRWSADSRMLTYVNTKQGVSNIWGQPIDGSPAKPLTDFKTDRIFRFAWSPDGKTLVCERGFYVNDVVLLRDFLS
ncbi:MAG TPA: winged helix-turn-helix domain-containing protein [Blastocatellia bacterium]|nr:winged helix-turn-helix domain-containing protein [Blastocatellia bacterium]